MRLERVTVLARLRVAWIRLVAFAMAIALIALQYGVLREPWLEKAFAIRVPQPMTFL